MMELAAAAIGRFGWSPAFALDGATAAFVLIMLRQAGPFHDATGPGLQGVEMDRELEASGWKPGQALPEKYIRKR